MSESIIGFLSCAAYPSEICDHGFKVKTTNIVSHVSFHTHMESLGDLVRAWTSCGREFNGVRGLYGGTIKVGRDWAFAHDYNYGLWGAGYQYMRKW